jgi:predicted dienelactone hydrolase
MYGKSAAAITEAQRKNLDRLLAAPAYARRDAARAEGMFPVLLYSHGAGGTYEENSGMFEYLASYGYVVLSTAFPMSRCSLCG